MASLLKQATSYRVLTFLAKTFETDISLQNYHKHHGNDNLIVNHQ